MSSARSSDSLFSLLVFLALSAALILGVLYVVDRNRNEPTKNVPVADADYLPIAGIDGSLPISSSSDNTLYSSTLKSESCESNPASASGLSSDAWASFGVGQSALYTGGSGSLSACGTDQFFSPAP